MSTKNSLLLSTGFCGYDETINQSTAVVLVWKLHDFFQLQIGH